MGLGDVNPFEGHTDMATDTDNDRTQFNFGLGTQTKKGWEDYVEESRNHATLAAFIRHCVNKEIESNGHTQTHAGVSEDLTERLTEIADTQKRLQETIAEVSEDVAAIKEQTSQVDEDLQDLAGQVFKALPTEDEATWRTGSLDLPGADKDYHGPDTGRVEDLADHIEAPRYRVRDALAHLQESSSMVRTTVVEGETRYYRRG